MNTDAHVVLSDGRRLAYAEFGRPDGTPVLYFHGAPSSRLEPLLLGDTILAAHGLRIIAPDRPGIGGSDFQPGRGFSHWPADVVAIADALGLGRFAVLGNSGGGPYAAVCAARIPDRLTAAVLVSTGWRMDWPEATDGMPLVNRVFMKCAIHAPPVLRLMLKAMGASSGGDRDSDLAQMKARVPAADYAAFAAPGRIEALAATMRECMRNGTKGPAWDLRLYMREFDFSLAEIRMPLTFFHGELDANAPIALVRRVVAVLPAARLVACAGDAHLSTLCGHFEEIAAALSSPAASAAPTHR